MTNAPAPGLDPYELQEGELTKPMVAELLGCSTRNVELLKKDGKLAATKMSRRIGGKVQKVLIFMQSDVDSFKAERDAPVEIPTIDRTSPGTAMTPGKRDDAIGMAMAMIANKVFDEGPAARPAFISIDDASAEYGLSPIEFHRLIDDGSLRRFSGKNGRAMLSRRQIESL